MKILLRLLIITTILSINNSLHAMQTAEFIIQNITLQSLERIAAHRIIHQQSYTNGGAIFNYPAGIFTQTPIITLAIEAAPHVDTFTFTSEISANSNTSTTIMVYKISNGGAVTEAATNDVIIHLEASGL